MEPSLELFVVSLGAYPRRILIYLSEKGLKDFPIIKRTEATVTENGMEAPGKPPGSVPMLKLPDGSFIKQSVAILEYLGDVCDHPNPKQEWQVQLAKTATGSLRGEMVEERVRAREMLALADEATSHFGFACHKGSKLFVSRERTSGLCGELVLEYCKKNLGLLENYYAVRPELRSGDRPILADFVFYSLIRFAKDFHEIDLLSNPELPLLKKFCENFGKREGASIVDNKYPEQFSVLARQWLPAEQVTIDRIIGR